METRGPSRCSGIPKSSYEPTATSRAATTASETGGVGVAHSTTGDRRKETDSRSLSPPPAAAAPAAAARGGGAAYCVIRGDSVVANEGKGEGKDLPRIRRIRQGLRVAHHS